MSRAMYLFFPLHGVVAKIILNGNRYFTGILAGLLFCVGGLPLFGQQASSLNLVASDWPPFTGEIGESRFAIELVHEALNRAGYEVSTHLVEDGAVTPGIESREYDGSPAFWFNEDRQDLVLFSRPYLENRLILVGRKGAEVDFDSFDELTDKRIAIVKGYAYGTQVEEMVNGPVFIEGNSLQDNLNALIRNRVDYLLVDELLARYLAEYQQADTDKFLSIGSKPLLRRSLYFVIEKNLPAAELIIKRFNSEISQMIEDGTYNKILRLNWIRADVDGDGNLELVLAGNGAGSNPPSGGYDVSPLKAGAVSAENDRYYIEGQLYNRWDDVPDEYKIDEGRWRDPSNTGVSLMKFDF